MSLRLTEAGGQRYKVGDKPVTCPFCAGTTFESRRGVLDTRGASFFGWTWANRGSTELICRGCGFLYTFADA